MTNSFSTPDSSRQGRLGFDEAIFCASKDLPSIVAILEEARDRDHGLLLTRLEAHHFAALPKDLRQRMDFEELSRTAYFGPVAKPSAPPRVAIVTAGTSDAAVAREAARTLRYYGQDSLEVHDVGVAGLWRLLERVDELRAMPVVIAVAGMDAALCSVLGGLLPSVVIAVPTSVGYGAAQEGMAALHAALSSCAPGLLVVNIDNGYGAANGALRVLQSTARLPGKVPNRTDISG
ncbi:MAG: nickel pincer cofactor biosynthesis protein LarB [Deltaproteobacteria bacterium]|nr:nickel pincer cofactor biosynthesis protein LarB [Deltaproteobacteria bacterium]